MKAIYPGSFDPVTNGHLDLIKRASKQVDELIIAVLNNPSKKSLFDLDEKIMLLKETTKEYENVKIDSFKGLLSDYVTQKDCKVIIRGLRAMSDLEYEMQMALTNKKLNPEIETFFLVSSGKHSYLSSSIVREVAMFGGDVSCFVPKIVEKSLKNKFKEAYNGRT